MSRLVNLPRFHLFPRVQFVGSPNNGDSGIPQDRGAFEVVISIRLFYRCFQPQSGNLVRREKAIFMTTYINRNASDDGFINHIMAKWSQVRRLTEWYSARYCTNLRFPLGSGANISWRSLLFSDPQDNLNSEGSVQGRSTRSTASVEPRLFSRTTRFV